MEARTIAQIVLDAADSIGWLAAQRLVNSSQSNDPIRRPHFCEMASFSLIRLRRTCTA